MRQAIANAEAVFAQPAPDEPYETADERIVFLGPDDSGRYFEIVGVMTDADALLVIHAMDMRDKYRDLLAGGGDDE